MTRGGSLSVLIPIKAFGRAKARLAPTLTPAAREELAREMATAVLQAAVGLDRWVVCDDEEVAAWARAHGASVSWQPGTGLNGAVNGASHDRFAAGARRVVVVHGDLPLVTSLDWVADRTDELLLVPDRHGTGTNLVSTPTVEFTFAYGKGSFARHRREADRLGLPTRVIHDPALGWDVDVPADLSAISGPETPMTGA